LAKGLSPEHPLVEVAAEFAQALGYGVGDEAQETGVNQQIRLIELLELVAADHQQAAGL